MEASIPALFVLMRPAVSSNSTCKISSWILSGEVALAAVKEQKTISQLAAQYGVHPTQIGQWKRHLVEGAAEVFEPRRASNRELEFQKREKELFEEIGRLKMDL